MPDTAALECLARGYGLLEGARWYPGTGLVFSDVTRGGVYGLPGPGAAVETLLPHRKGIGGLVGHRDGGYIVAGRNVAHKTPAAPDQTTVLLHTSDAEQFFNDLTADGLGRVYVGSVAIDPLAPDRTRPPRPGRLYRIGLDREVTVVADDVLISNGLGTSPDGEWLYHVDTGRCEVRAHAIGAGATEVPSSRLFAHTEHYPGRPDGLAVADDGSVWVAMAGGGLVVGWDAGGRPIAEIAVPQPLVTTLCFGGDELRTLFVLTGVNDEFPDERGGGVWTAPSPVTGRPAPMAAVALPA